MSDLSTRSKDRSLKNEMLTVKEVATYLRVSRTTVWRWCQQGTIPASQVGRSWRIRRNDLMRLLERSPPSLSTSVHPGRIPKNDDGTQTSLTDDLEKEKIVDDAQDNSKMGPDEDGH